MKFCLIIFIVLFYAANASAQKKAAYALRSWVRDSLPAKSDSLTDMQRMDMIYFKALQINNYRKENAFIDCVIATMEHQSIPLSWDLRKPLTKETQPDYYKRMQNLPQNLFADKKQGYDSDKMQHFFASAWVTYSLNSRFLADILGIAVEIAEQALIANDPFDNRDLRANRLGQNFAKTLITNRKAMPSQFFMEWNAQYIKSKTR